MAFIRKGENNMIKNLEKEVENITKWIADYVKQAKAEGVVIGNSGGKDCATVMALAAKALGSDKVLAIAMPCHSQAEDLEDAKLVANQFYIPLLEIDVTKAYDAIEKETVKAMQVENLAKEIGKEASINSKPRIRMTTLYMVAQTLNYLVIGTGNLCERMVGYTTKWGDSSSDFNPIGNFTVEEVLQIGEYLGVPDKVIHKAPNDGLGGLTDEQKMGITYAQITQYIDTGKTKQEAMEKIEKKYRISAHKRREIPMYPYERKNLLEKAMQEK